MLQLLLVLSRRRRWRGTNSTLHQVFLARVRVGFVGEFPTDGAPKFTEEIAMHHPYWTPAKLEQRLEAIERNRLEAVRFLDEARLRRPTGRVLEAIEIRH